MAMTNLQQFEREIIHANGLRLPQLTLWKLTTRSVSGQRRYSAVGLPVTCSAKRCLMSSAREEMSSLVKIWRRW